MGIAYRDELLFRWIPSRLGTPLASPQARAAFTVVFGAAPVFYGASDRPASVAVMLGVGVLTSALMLRRESFGLIVGAHAAVIFVTSTVFSSALDARWAEGSLVVLERASGTPGWVLGITLAIAGAIVLRARRPTQLLSRRNTLSHEPAMFAQRAGVHHHRHPGVVRSLRRGEIDHTILKPQHTRADRDRVVDRGRHLGRSSKHIDHIDRSQLTRLGEACNHRNALDRGSGMTLRDEERVHARDPISVGGEVPSDLVRGSTA
jgi:hypothetical protein